MNLSGEETLKTKIVALEDEIERLKAENEKLKKWKQTASWVYEVECCSKCEEFYNDKGYTCHFCKEDFCSTCWEGFHSDFLVAGTQRDTLGVCRGCVSAEKTCKSCHAPNPSVICPSSACGRVFCSEACQKKVCLKEKTLQVYKSRPED